MKIQLPRHEFEKMWKTGPLDYVRHTDIARSLQKLSPSLVEDWEFFQSRFNTKAKNYGAWMYEHFSIIIDGCMTKRVDTSFKDTKNPEFWKAWYRRKSFLTYEELPTIKEVI